MKECRATVMGYCLSDVQGDTACDTQAGECVHEEQPGAARRGGVIMTAKLEVEGFENRGTAEHPFGFITFTDGMRIGYSPGAEGTNEIGLFNAKQPYLLERRGAELRARHIALATEFVNNVLAKPEAE